MIRMRALAISLILCLSVNPLIANASFKSSDPLQVYRDEIKQTESDASQTLLGQLNPDSSDSNPYTNAPSAQPTPPPPSNSERAFSPPVQAQKNARPNASVPQTHANPWEKPNPWEAQSKVNPWANAPIPGPTPPTASSPNSSFTPISPPNIFAPSQSASTPKKPS